MSVAFWRKWHRYIAWPASIFLLFAATTGVAIAITEKFGAAEVAREAAREDVSSVKLGARSDSLLQAIAAALDAAHRNAGALPLDRLEVQFKGISPAINLYTGKPEGGEDRKFVMDLQSGGLRAVEPYVDKPFLNRLHSGEAIGDGGLILAILWGTALAVITASGLVIYLRMRRPGAVGVKRFFW
jgi:uncharacterized iron-regulated membrane protein